MEKENERFQIWINFAQFFIGTFILGVVTLLVNNKIQEREIEIKEQEQIGTLVDKALDENVESRLRLAKFYSTVTRSNEIRERWGIYRGELQKEFDALLAKANTKQKEINDAEKNNIPAIKIEELKSERDSALEEITPKTILLNNLTSRVYFHINNESQREKLQVVLGAISKPSELIVPGIQLISSYQGGNELRYFRVSEKDEAEKITKSIKALLNLDIQTTYVAGYEDNKKIRPRHFELWISKLN